MEKSLAREQAEFDAAPRRNIDFVELMRYLADTQFIPVERYATAKPCPCEVGCLVTDTHIRYQPDGVKVVNRSGTAERLFIASPAAEKAGA